MQLLTLEDRSLPSPSPIFSRDGFVIRDAGGFTPFPDFLRSHYTAEEGDVVVVGAAPGGGPRVQVRTSEGVIADFFAGNFQSRTGVKVAYSNGIIVTSSDGTIGVWDTHGANLSRFVPYGGIPASVAIRHDRILTVPADRGGPHVREYLTDGTPLGSSWGSADIESREGWDLLWADVTHDLYPDIVLLGVDVTINEGRSHGRQVVQYPRGFTSAGYDGETFTIGGDGYVRGKTVWTSFETMLEFDVTDAAAGNQNPPPTSGTRPGVFLSSGGRDTTGDLSLSSTSFSSDSVGVPGFGTGSSYYPIDGKWVTASHVVRGSPYQTSVHDLYAPGPADGKPVKVGIHGSPVPILPEVPYVVDAATFTPLTPPDHRVHLGNQTVELEGVAQLLGRDETLIAVGRGQLVGVGRVEGYQASPVSIRWPDGASPLIDGQIIGVRGATRLAEPGFSGGVAFTVRWDERGPHRLIVGMVVAGNQTFTFITPHDKIVEAVRGQ